MIKQPVFTEKSFKSAANGIYSFELMPHALKSQIKKQIEELFQVHVTKLTTSIRKGKSIRVARSRRKQISNPVKIARVWLKKGEKIAIFDIQKD